MAIALFALGLVPTYAHGQFELGLQDFSLQQPAATAAARAGYGAMRAIDGSTVRISVEWSEIAPGGTKKPSGFQPSNPADPRYDWRAIDLAIRTATREGSRVILVLFRAPKWAQGAGEPAAPAISAGAWDPNPSEFAQFARAAALRYDGGFPDPLNPAAYLPRVSLWEVWNEENLPYYLAAPDLVGEYRALLNAGYTAIKSIHPDDVVAIGGLAPVSFLPPYSVSPLKFAADLLCLQRTGTTFRASSVCPQRASFDVFAHHPYTLAATPTKPAYRYDDVLIGDMEKIAHLLQAADRLHTVAPRIHHQLWVTEFGWFTNPPNKVVGDSDSTAARYVAYSMYEMWRSGVSLVIWQTIRDYSTADPLGGGLYTSSGRPKLTLRAFSFPVVASVGNGRGFIWGRAPIFGSGMVVEQNVGGRWRQLATTTSGPDGVFYVPIRARTNGLFRARIPGGAVSLAYDSTPIPPKRTHLFFSG